MVVYLNRLPEDSPHGRFATEDSPQRRYRLTTGETYECDREFERKRRTNVCNSADVEDSPHNGNRLGLGGLKSRGWVGGFDRGVGPRGWGGGVGNPYPPAQPNSPTSTPLTPTHPTPTYHRCVANLPHRHCCKHLSDHRVSSNSRSHSLCGKSSVANLPCGESSGNL